MIPGEVFNGRYEVLSQLGDGVYSNVFKAKDIQTHKFVAVKIQRKNDMMRQSARQEIEILQKLNDVVPRKCRSTNLENTIQRSPQIASSRAQRPS